MTYLKISIMHKQKDKEKYRKLWKHPFKSMIGGCRVSLNLLDINKTKYQDNSI